MDTNGFINAWLSYRNALIELVDTVNDEHLDYKPWGSAMSLSELYQHIKFHYPAYSSKYLS